MRLRRPLMTPRPSEESKASNMVAAEVRLRSTVVSMTPIECAAMTGTGSLATIDGVNGDGAGVTREPATMLMTNSVLSAESESNRQVAMAARSLSLLLGVRNCTSAFAALQTQIQERTARSSAMSMDGMLKPLFVRPNV